jgi:RNA polymerase sigma factor (sigma-70 family)
MVDETGGLSDLIREAGSYKPLQPDEQDRMLKAAGGGDQASQERLVAAYLPTVVRLAAARADEGLSVPDLVQEGSIGLLQAVREFAGSGERDFRAFAEAHIAGQLTRAIEEEAAAVREAQLLVTAAEDYARTEVLLRRTLLRAPTEAELAEKLEWTVERLRYVAKTVDDARRRHDEELLAYIDPETIALDDGDPDSEVDPSLN